MKALFSKAPQVDLLEDAYTSLRAKALASYGVFGAVPDAPPDELDAAAAHWLA